MELILKNKEKIKITSMSRNYSCNDRIDENGEVIERRANITFFVDGSEDIDEIESKITKENAVDFYLMSGNKKKAFDKWQIEKIVEELTDDKDIITIRLSEK